MSISAVVPDDRPHRQAHNAKAAAPVAAEHPDLEGKLIYFFHIPKTGGRTITNHFEERFGADSVFRPKKCGSWYADFFLGEKNASPSTGSAQHVMGHFAPISLLHGREQDYFKICFWRHPADWLLSYYNYRHFRKAKVMKRGFSFADFQGSVLRNPMTEHLLLYSAGIPGLTYFFMSDRAKFEAALVLIARFDQFTDMANVDAFVAAVGYTGKGKPKDCNRIDKRNKKIAALPEQARRDVERTSPVDYFLHRLASGEDRRVVCAQARRALRSKFDVRDILRLAAMPYYRFKIWVWPFLPSVRSWVSGKAPTSGEPPHAGDTRTLH